MLTSQSTPRSAPETTAVAGATVAQQLEFTLSPQRVAAQSMAIGWRLGGRLDPTLVGRALHEIVRRHDSLRSCLHEVNGEIVQVIDRDAGSIRLQTASMLSLRPGLRGRALQRLIVGELRRPIRLDRLPQVRPFLIKVADQQHVLVLVLSHTFWDAASSWVFIDEFASIYDALTDGTAVAAPPPVQLSDYAQWERRERARCDPRAVARWLERPAWRPRLRTPSAHGSAIAAMSIGLAPFPSWLMRRLRMVAQASGSTATMALLASFAAALYLHTGQEHQVIALMRSLRHEHGFDTTIGCLVENLPVAITVTPSSTFRQLVRAARDDLASMSGDGMDMARMLSSASGVLLKPGHASCGASLNSIPNIRHALPISRHLHIRRYVPAMWWNVFDVQSLWEYDVLNVSMAASGPRGSMSGRFFYNSGAMEPRDARSMARELGVMLRVFALWPDSPMEEQRRRIRRLADRLSPSTSYAADSSTGMVRLADPPSSGSD